MSANASKPATASATSPHSAATEERFVIARPDKIAQLLLQLQGARTLIRMRWGEAQQFLTTVLEVYKQRGLLILDPSQTEQVNQQLAGAERIACDGNHQGILFRFALGRMSRGELGELPVFAASLPEWLYWRDRREHFRVSAPQQPPLLLTLPPTSNAPLQQLPIIDLGPQGLAFAHQGQQPLAEVGTRLPKCRLNLPDYGECQFDLEIRNVTVYQSPQRGRMGKPTQPAKAKDRTPAVKPQLFRYGCAVSAILYATQQHLFLYLNDRQRELRNLGK